jgi:hypothetical protein
MCILVFLRMFPRNKITFYFNLRNSHELRTKRTVITREDLKLAYFSVCVHVKRLQGTVCL